jgi:hypothetical protein
MEPSEVGLPRGGSDRKGAPMHKLERQMLDILKRGRDEFGYTATKAEFEAEGTRTDELLRLMEITRKADLDFGLKIGGCEAMRDLMEARQIGVEYVIAPMIESPYALSKYIDAKNIVFTEDQQRDTRFLFNLETETAFNVLPELVDQATQAGGADGIVFGRTDFTLSTGRDRNDINTDEIVRYCTETAKALRDTGLDFVVGGGVSMDSIEALKEIRNVYLSRFETRKIIFEADALDRNNLEDGFLAAVQFELLWLLNKREYYHAIQQEDVKRIETLESRWHVLAPELTGTA